MDAYLLVNSYYEVVYIVRGLDTLSPSNLRPEPFIDETINNCIDSI